MTEEIRPNLFRIQVPLPDSPLKFLNSYVIKSDTRNLVIDTGLNRDACYDAMQAGFKALNIDPAKTDYFITHLHADHFGLVKRLTTKTSQIYFNRPETEIIEGWGGWEPMIAYADKSGFPKGELESTIKQHPGHKFGSEWIPELNILSEGDRIDIGDYHFRCIATPGHSLGHMCLYEADKKLLVAGDHILVDITPNIQCWSDTQNPLGNYLENLDRVRDFDIDLVLPGHRRLIDDHKARIDALKKHHRDRLDEVLMILKDKNGSSPYEVASKMTWDIKADSWEDFPSAQKWFATGEAIAHLRYLEEKGQITRTLIGDRFYFSLSHK